MKKELDNIIPFSEFWLGSCYPHAIMSALPHYGISRQDFFAANLWYTERDFTIPKEALRGYDGFCSKLGVKLRKFSATMPKAVCQKIDNGNAVVAGLDFFEVPLRKEYYHNIHSLHFLLIWGYDTEKQIFHIVDHDYVNSLNFVKRELDFDTFAKASVSAIHFCNKHESNLTCKEIEKSQKTDPNLLSEYFSKRRKLVASAEAAKINLTKFFEILSSGLEELMINYHKIVVYFNSECLLKNSLIYVVGSECAETTVLLEKIISGYKFLTTVIWKINATKEMKSFEEKKEKIKSKVEMLIEDVGKLHDFLIVLGKKKYALL